MKYFFQKKCDQNDVVICSSDKRTKHERNSFTKRQNIDMYKCRFRWYSIPITESYRVMHMTDDCLEDSLTEFILSQSRVEVSTDNENLNFSWLTNTYPLTDSN